MKKKYLSWLAYIAAIGSLTMAVFLHGVISLIAAIIYCCICFIGMFLDREKWWYVVSALWVLAFSIGDFITH